MSSFSCHGFQMIMYTVLLNVSAEFAKYFLLFMQGISLCLNHQKVSVPDNLEYSLCYSLAILNFDFTVQIAK